MLQIISSLRILDLMRCFKRFIEAKHKDGMIPRMLTYSAVRKTKFVKLEEAKKEEELFTSFDENANKKDFTTEIFQCDLLDKAKMKLDELGILWDGHKQ